ncbi:hypothetical protein ACH5RR_028148 [Cinchona calisaya]|uniref:Nuclease associated modular domain-containing protein n=1 Tax=Cinchona calisaya TaxID=153742 RepID=A0ABD2YR82_9GENT
MLLSHLKLPTSHLHKDSNLLVPNSGYAVEQIQVIRSSTVVSFAGVSRMKVSPLVTPVSLCIGPYCCGGLHASIGTLESFHVAKHCLKDGSHLLKEQTFTKDTQGDNYSNMAKISNSENEREIDRRRKIGLANKGKVPWNKGRKHSEETREIIRQKTIEALKDPKVRKKMSECPRTLSNRTKARIRMSVRKLWGKRLKWKRSREKFFQLWAESIARAAKTGGSDQQELEWDSYEKMKREIALQQLEWAAQMAKEKEMERILAERSAEEMKKELAQKKKETRKKSKEEKEELAVNQEFKLKAKLMKIHKQKSTISRVSSQQQRIWENLDMKFKRTKQNQVTLADQIRLAKVRRAESVTQ